MVGAVLLFRKIVGIMVLSVLMYVIRGLFSSPNFDLGQYVTEVAVALTVIMITIGYWTFRPDLERFSFMISENEQKMEQKKKEDNVKKVEDHRYTLNSNFLTRRAQLIATVFTWVEMFKAFNDSKQYLQHLYTGQPELYEELKNLMSTEIEVRATRPAPAELKQLEDVRRISVKSKFDELQTRIRQKTDDLGGICDHCTKFYDPKNKDFKLLKAKLSDFTSPF